jgi:hypothetical protein
MESVENCPTLIILEDDEGIDEESEDATVENHVDIQYWFPNNGNPTCSNSGFHSQSDLVDALLTCKEPTLIFTSKNYQPDYKLTLPLCFPFTIKSKRHVSDLFLNTNNPVISKIFGYSNNVLIGNRNCIYYVTLYNTKGNQEEEQFPFLKHCTELAKRIRKLRQAEMDIENQFENNGEVRTYAQTPNFSVGLGHVLSGIIAHLSSTVINAPMAWHLVIKESKFQFSHEFSHILLSQFENWLKDKDIHFRFQRSKNEGTGWVDSNLFQYLYRPDYGQFDTICVWEYFKEYEMRLISTLSSNQKANLENDYEENHFFKFKELYPGHQFACVEKLKKSKVPMLYNDKIPDVELCKLGTAFGENDIDATTTNIWNEYATKMLLLFSHFKIR